jgi:exopolyphosphatase / guanosine-5'-triphosphate,3'-diphosphate pyrophosphatase
VWLEAAAYLHEAGCIIDYTRHHKHAYHLIRHAPLTGLSAHEIEIVALLARYHRGAAPKRRHEGFGQLARRDRRAVRRLAALLRIADGLDRAHAARVNGLTVAAQDAAVVVTARGTGDLQAEAWGARRKLGLFRRAFGTRLRIDIVAEASE